MEQPLSIRSNETGDGEAVRLRGELYLAAMVVTRENNTEPFPSGLRKDLRAMRE